MSGKTKEEARKALREARSGADQGLVFDAARLTVAEYLDRWLKDSVQGSVRRSTYESYLRQVRRYITPAVGCVRLKALTPAHVKGLYREVHDCALSARTVEYTHAVLHRALKQAVLRRAGLPAAIRVEDAQATATGQPQRTPQLLPPLRRTPPATWPPTRTAS